MSLPNNTPEEDAKLAEQLKPKERKPAVKERHYKTTEGQFFCPSCHRQVQMPFKGIRVTGKLRIGCGMCGKGVIVIQMEAPKEPEITDKPHEDL